MLAKALLDGQVDSNWDVAQSELASRNFEVQGAYLDSPLYGIPQSRRRFYVVGLRWAWGLQPDNSNEHKFICFCSNSALLWVASALAARPSRDGVKSSFVPRVRLHAAVD